MSEELLKLYTYSPEEVKRFVWTENLPEDITKARAAFWEEILAE